MARSRNIKPSFFKNEILGQADPLLGLLFISLWTLADKSGRLEDRPLRIKAETFPYRENVDVNGYLTQLVSLGFIWRYVVNGEAYIQVIEFVKHQSPHSTEKTSELPECPKELRTKTMGYKILPLDNESASVTSHINVLIPDSLIPDSPNPLTPKRENSVDVGFNEFWFRYPKKVGKDAAKKAWQKKKPRIDDVMFALSWQINSEQWTKSDGQFIPNPATYLNQGRWMDEPTKEESF